MASDGEMKGREKYKSALREKDCDRRLRKGGGKDERKDERKGEGKDERMLG